MQEIRASFFIECEELLEALQDALIAMEDEEVDPETINVAFRAVHSIKGGAGAFGLDQLVSFAHAFESAMDEVRAGTLELGAEVVGLFFQCGDRLSDLVKSSRDGVDLDEAQIAPLIAQLDEAIGKTGDEEDNVEEVTDFQPMGISLDLPDLDLPDDDDEAATASEPSEETPDLSASEQDDVLTNMLRVSFKPEPELYKSGNEPVFLLRALQALGETEITCAIAKPEDLKDHKESAGLLAWVINLQTNTDAGAVREVFDFVDGLCTLEVEQVGPVGEKSQETVDVATTALEPVVAEILPEASEPTIAPEADIPELPAAAPKTIETPKPTATSAAKAPQKAASSGSGATVRVDLDRVDRLVNLVGELVINQAMLSQSIAAVGLHGNTKIETGLDELLQLTRDIQDSVMMIRAQPVKSLFQRMGRIVRESSASVGKKVRLVTEGEGTEIDKTVIERLADPLTHMIRNAVDHGLESGEDRLASGKSEEGQVTLSASHRSGRVVIEVADDGGGINRAKVKSIAEEKGLIPPGQELSDSEIDNLLFLPGFSTANEVSNLSGRGVGMDVVKNAINALGGRITISSEAKKGTTFSISLPLTLAVLDGMVVTVGAETLVVPLNAISETLSVGNSDIQALGPNTHVIQVRDAFVPLIDLSAELGYSNPRSDYQDAIVLLISQEDNKRAALVVDGIEDQRQVVIKGLQDSYGRVPGVAAATILGDGQIALILDPSDLLQNATGLSRPNAPLAEVG